MSKADVLSTIEHKEPSCLPQSQDFYLVLTPGEHSVDGVPQPDGRTIGDDWFGCSWTEFGSGPIDGSTITTGTRRLEELEDFPEAMVTPEQVRAYDWEGFAKNALAGYDPEKQLLQVRSLVGFFERLHCLIGFEDALCSFYEEPETVREFFDAMLAYKKEVATQVAKWLHPDVMIFDDDYGTMKSTFLSPDMWREFFPPYWKELNEHVHSLGMRTELHSCGYITPLVEDFVEVGFDILQPLQTNNDLKLIKETVGDRLVLRLAIFDKQMATLGVTEEQARADLRSWYETLAPGGGFLPDLVPIDDPYYVMQREVQDEFEHDRYGV